MKNIIGKLLFPVFFVLGVATVLFGRLAELPLVGWFFATIALFLSAVTGWLYGWIG